jgi:hypothetical protein
MKRQSQERKTKEEARKPIPVVKRSGGGIPMSVLKEIFFVK